MCRLRELNNYLTFFYLFGQTAYKIPQRNKKINISIVYHLPKFIYFFVLIGIVICITIEISRWSKLADFSWIVGYISLVIYTISTSCSFYLNTFYPLSSQSIFWNVASIIKHVEYTLKAYVPIGNFVSRYRRKILIILLVELIGSIVKLTIRSKFFVPITEVFFILTVIYRDCMIFYFVMIIDLFELILHSTNSAINNAVRNRIAIDEKLRILRELKWTHFHTWKTFEIINSR